MLRVCGITYDHTVNFGSNFQAYALQTVIQNMEINGEKCSYQIVPLQVFKDYPKPDGIIKKMGGFAASLFGIQFRKMRKKMNFAPINQMSELTDLNNSTDAFVCGSDVVWNPDLNHNLDAFYLSFANKYAFSYAASFGKSDLGKEYLNSLEERLSKLRRISVRERSGISVIQEHTSHKASLVLDPVLLIHDKEWDRLADHTPVMQKHIFVYLTHITPTINAFIQNLQKQTGLKVLLIVWSPKQALKYRVLPRKPEQWLQLLRDAEYVVTNSFHATAFSILYHKKFFTVVQGDKDKGINIRMNDLLNDLGLQDRIFSSVPETVDLSDIDYTNADRILEEKRAESMAFLRENLEAAYREKLELEQKEHKS